MSKQSSFSEMQPGKQTVPRAHPLQILSESDIKQSVAILKDILSKETELSVEGLRFKNISLHEPPKKLLLPYLDAEAAGVPASQRPYVPRCIDLIWSTCNESIVRESTVSLDTGREVSRSGPGKGQHGAYDRSVSCRLLLRSLLIYVDSKQRLLQIAFSTTQSSLMR